ncbi:MAG TPA: winged helix-turn-helix domain-containing protein [Terracidiphilus sp.]|jgi:DNA-binding winged helix-turn-helix (wHTH) protein|nr:winged helix-turn-helix domain-containing protein [Terracidiphilus sp.]
MSHRFSKQNQSSVDTAYRFGKFELYPEDRLLRRAGRAVTLQPRAFDALLCLVRHAQHLVTKQELMATLWPRVHVSEANLTNLIGALRKVVGRNTIRTVSKHGYRFEPAVLSEPGVRRSVYGKFLRAKELTETRTIPSMQMARELYWTALAEDPNFAPAWAWLGRCCWFLDKFSTGSSAKGELARAALERAFALDADLAAAHQFYAMVEVDTGYAAQAMERLLKRLRVHPDEPETFTILVQVLRFRGLLRQSMEAHQRAIELDPDVTTSVAHTYFLAGDYAAAIESYGGRGGYYLDAAAWAALGETEHARGMLRERMRTMPLSELMRALLGSLAAVLEDKKDEAVRLMESADAAYEPEILVYFARHYARLGNAAEAARCLQRAAKAGFVCGPETLAVDPWLSPLRKRNALAAFAREAQALVRDAEAAVAGKLPELAG